MVYAVNEDTALKETFQDIYLSHYSYIFRFIYWRVKDIRLSEDITQEVFLRAWMYIEKLSVHPEIRGWLMKTSKTTIVDFMKAQNQNDNTLSELILFAKSDLRATSSNTPDFLKKLPAQHLQILQLMFGDEMTLQEIAKELNISVDAVKKRSSRAQKKLVDLAIENNYLKKNVLSSHFLTFFLVNLFKEVFWL